MRNNILFLFEEANKLSQKYGINPKIFVIIYILSIIPIYFGFFLIIYGSLGQVSIKDILKFKIKRLTYNKKVISGIITTILGIIIPYVYILFWSKNLPAFFHLIVLIVILFLIFIFFLKIKRPKNKVESKCHFSVIRKEIIEESQKEDLWKIYDSSFSPLNDKTPCRQSFDKEHFFCLLSEPSAIKYIAIDDRNKKNIGMGLITRNFRNTPWISEAYFKAQFKEKYLENKIYYFMGIVVLKEYRGKGCSKILIKKIINDLPLDAAVGFDHSKGINPFIPNFVKIADKKRKVKKKYLDSQNYYIVS